MHADTTRMNIYLLPSGRVVARRMKWARSGGLRLAAGVAPVEMAKIERLFVKSRDRSRFVLEAACFNARQFTGLYDDARRRALARLYAARIAEIRAGRDPATIEVGQDIELGRA